MLYVITLNIIICVYSIYNGIYNMYIYKYIYVHIIYIYIYVYISKIKFKIQSSKQSLTYEFYFGIVFMEMIYLNHLSLIYLAFVFIYNYLNLEEETILVSKLSTIDRT